MTEPAPARPTQFRTGGLSQRKPTRFSWTPDAAGRKALADELGLIALYRMEFTGQIDPVGRDEFRLQARLTAALEQACIVTLAPVPAQVDEDIRRRYVADLPTPQGDETEIPEDDSLEPLPDVLNLIEIATEALMLTLPLYPRAPGAEFASLDQGAAPAEPAEAAQQKPFAGLASLAERLQKAPKTPGKDGE